MVELTAPERQMTLEIALDELQTRICVLDELDQFAQSVLNKFNRTDDSPTCADASKEGSRTMVESFFGKLDAIRNLTADISNKLHNIDEIVG